MELRGLQAAVVGAGVGGLAAALALKAAGASVAVYERAAALGEVGQGLGLFANAVRALDALGVGEAARRAGWRIDAADTLDARGRSLMRINLADHERRTGTPSLLMRRPDLHALLLERLGPGAVRTGQALEALEPGSERGRARLHFATGYAAEADLVVGADGWRSRVRERLWGSATTRDSGLICWRGMAFGVRLDRPRALPVFQGAGAQFGIGPLGPDSAYWFACYPARWDVGDADPHQAKARLRDIFVGFPAEVARLVDATPAEALLRTPLLDHVPLERWSRGRATLLGDAAHAMVPTLGQGAATALEDAVVLARTLGREARVEEALAAYEAERIPRTTGIVRAAWTLARLSAWTHPLAVAARDLSLRLTPPAWVRDRTERQIAYDAARVA